MSDANTPISMAPLKVPLSGRHVVEASAGTGKTFTIATLHLRFVLEAGVPASKVLVATFTDAATAELKNRLRANLVRAKRLCDAPGAEAGDAADEVAQGVLEAFGVEPPDAADRPRAAAASRRLEKALSAFDAAPVFTLHGFCQRLLTELAFESGARFEEELLTDAGPLIDAAVADFAGSAFGDPASPLARAVPGSPAAWRSLRGAARLAVEHPDAGVVPADDPELVERLEAAGEALRGEWLERGGEAAADLKAVASSLHAFLQKRLDGDLEDLDAALRSRRWADTPEYLCQPKLGTKVKKGCPAPDDPFFVRLGELRELALSPAADPGVRAAVGVAGHARGHVAEAKRAGGLLTFDDLLGRVAAALADPEHGDALRRAVRGRYPVAMIDEVQDTDPLQHRILEDLFGEVGDEPGMAYLSIGDPKQSIYRFRGADVAGFVASRERTAPDRRHGLQVNFRTDAPLVAAAQAVFGVAGAEPFGPTGISLPPVAAQHPRRVEADGPALLFRRVRVAGGDGEKLPRKPAATRAAVRALVADVVALLAEAPRIGGGDGEEGRRSAAGDVAVLCSTNVQLDRVARALEAAGVPAVRPSGESVFRSPEASATADLAAAWLDPSNTPRLRRAMLGPVLAAEPESLADPDALAAAASLAAECGRRWRRSGFAAAVGHLLSSGGAVPRLAGEVRGERTLTNLLHLSELLQSHAQESGATPESLLSHLRACVEDPNRWDGEEAAELRLESDAAAVKLLTVHRSKGLEFPFVFLPMLWDPPGLRVDKPFLFRGFRGDTPEIDAGSEAYETRKAADQEEQAREALRLLYVALTRAKHRVVAHWVPVAGTVRGPMAALMREAVGADDAELKGDAGWDRLLGRWVEKADAAACADAGVEPGSCVGWEEADAPRAAVAPREPEPQPALALRKLGASPPAALRSASFSSMTAGGHAADRAGEAVEPVDRDGPATREPEAPVAAAEPGPLDEMPGGTGVGLLVHAVLEEALEAPASGGGDAGSAAWCRARVAEAAPTHGLDPVWADPLGDALAATLSRPVLPGPPASSLLGVPPLDRSVELPFALGAGSAEAVSADAVAAVLETSGHGPTAETGRRLRRSGFLPFRGFLEGFIDLAVRYGERWHVVDHKSNKLREGYEPAALEEAMVHAMYLLQGHLYLAAMFRLLGGGAAADGELGGMAYLFVRGIAGPGDNPLRGIYTHRPEPALIAELSRVLEAGWR